MTEPNGVRLQRDDKYFQDMRSGLSVTQLHPDPVSRSSLQRVPTSAELAQVTEFIESSMSGNATAEEARDVWARFIQTLWATPEFRFLD